MYYDTNCSEFFFMFTLTNPTLNHMPKTLTGHSRFECMCEYTNWKKELPSKHDIARLDLLVLKLPLLRTIFYGQMVKIPKQKISICFSPRIHTNIRFSKTGEKKWEKTATATAKWWRQGGSGKSNRIENVIIINCKSRVHIRIKWDESRSYTHAGQRSIPMKWKNVIYCGM